jgi:phage terminase small subunit
VSGPLKNARHERFAQEYLLDLNATQAAIRTGYSAKTAEQQGNRVFRNVQVQARIAELQAERAERTKIDADWVLARLAQEMQADVADLYDDDGKVKPIRQWPMIWRQGLVAGIESFPEKVGEDEHGKPSTSAPSASRSTTPAPMAA